MSSLNIFDLHLTANQDSFLVEAFHDGKAVAESGFDYPVSPVDVVLELSRIEPGRPADTRKIIENHGRALAKYEESLRIKKELGHKSGIALTIFQIGRVAEDTGNLPAALEKYRIALQTFVELKSPNAEIAQRAIERVEQKLKSPGGSKHSGG